MTLADGDLADGLRQHGLVPLGTEHARRVLVPVTQEFAQERHQVTARRVRTTVIGLGAMVACHECAAGTEMEERVAEQAQVLVTVPGVVQEDVERAAGGELRVQGRPVGPDVERLNSRRRIRGRDDPSDGGRVGPDDERHIGGRVRSEHEIQISQEGLLRAVEAPAGGPGRVRESRGRFLPGVATVRGHLLQQRAPPTWPARRTDRPRRHSALPT